MNQENQNIIDPNLQYQNMLNMNIPSKSISNTYNTRK